MNTYDVRVTREDGMWLADVPALPGAHTFARSLVSLRQDVREVIALMADLPDEAVDDESAFTVRVSFDLPGRLAAEVDEARRLRDQLRVIEDSTRRATAEAARDLNAQGVSLRDSAEILDVSFQRVQQLVSS